MDFNTTIDLIIRDLEEARKIIDDLKNYHDVPLLQVELAKSKCKSAAEVISLLKENKEKIIPQKEEAESPVHHSPVPPADTSPEKTLVEDIREEPGENENEAADAGQSPDKKPYVAPIIADTFSHLAKSFHEELGKKKTGEDLHKKLHQKPIRSISEGIGVNDRFFYIKEVFNGDKSLYADALAKLDKATSFGEAQNILAELRAGKPENDATKQLLELVKRKFPHHE